MCHIWSSEHRRIALKKLSKPEAVLGISSCYHEMLLYGMRNSKASDDSSPAPGLHMARVFILTGDGAKAGISGASKPEASGR